MREMVEQFTCDRCQGITKFVATFKVHVGYCAGAVSQEYDIRCVDLCFICAAVALQRICNLSKDFEQAQLNKQMESVPTNMSVPRYAMPNLPMQGARRTGLASMRQAAAEAMAKRFGPGIFANE